MAAVPIAIPSADSAARSGRARSPTLATPARPRAQPSPALRARPAVSERPGRRAPDLAGQLVGEPASWVIMTIVAAALSSG
jgi:hypothetical protein